MEREIARLRELNKSVPRPLPRPTPADVEAVERVLGITLPKELVELQLGAGDVVYGSYEPVTLTPAGGHTYIVTVAQDAWSVGVPRDYVPICENNGDYFCIDPSGRVVYWSHNGTTDESWPSLAVWVRDVWLDNAL